MKKVVKKKKSKKATPKFKIPEGSKFRHAEFSRDLKKARAANQLTLREAAVATKVPMTTLHWMEKGGHIPSVESFAKAVSFYNLDPASYVK